MSQNPFEGLLDLACPVIKDEPDIPYPTAVVGGVWTGGEILGNHALVEDSGEADNNGCVINSFHPPRDIVIDVPDEVFHYSSDQTTHIASARVIVIGGIASRAISKAIVNALVAAAGCTVGTAHPIREPAISFDNFWRTHSLPPEWRWSNLHYKLSLEGSLEKFKRQQQRQKSLFKHDEQKRIKKGRSHAKQKHKGMSRGA